ncbi:Flagellar biosynthesis protein FlhA [Pirellula sp. SH-Sr6A]|uniref:flagellar biosynthesis protein FlhA n=1 Tax=Pirellula sp. SH-Sr6A TaxID=1632865 RepID=UPI00078BF0A8|nr:flagellar biosynthesis protein FlhA [Pirellula sp. SH-Sr6A]AMV32927.1 Flagellar biosynthesis protein FlhA [Pirellula sp. SH-Sr6A]
MGNWLRGLERYTDAVVPIGIIACLVVILVPLPPSLLDVLLSANIAIGVVVLLTTIYIQSPLEFNIFPAMLVATTLSRLVLNLATTRLILTHAGEEKLDAAGDVIRAFGEFVSGDSIEVGIILFVIIFLINFIVITKGATRIGEVAARFALDGMPGRQMAIDADLSAGAIDEKEAQRRREEITRQADFYGAMDGASKFVRGDAIAGIAITMINLFGGLYMGYMYADMTLVEAANVYSKLTIGDGLVSQVPAFLISLAAALLTTRSTQKSNFSNEFLKQIFSRPEALIISGAFLMMLIFTGLPTLPMFSMGAGCIGLAVLMKSQVKKGALQEAAKKQAESEAKKEPPPEKKAEDYLEVDPMRLELGAKLIPLADPNRGGDLMKRISTVRATLATEMGILLPMVRIKDRMSLPEYSYELSMNGNRIASGMLRPDRLLAIDSGLTLGPIQGDETTDPAFGKRAFWIEPKQRQQAEIYGYQVAECAAVLATHVQETARRHAEELLTREVTKQLIDQLKKGAPTVVEELIPQLMKLSDVQQVLQNLLREDVPIRQLGLILETLGDFAHRVKDPIWLTEYVRHRLARTISHRYRDNAGVLKVVTLDPAMEDRIAAGAEQTDRGIFIRMAPETIQKTCQKIAEGLKKLEQQGRTLCVLVSPKIRVPLRQITQDNLPNIRILSYNEVSRDTTVESVAMVSD